MREWGVLYSQQEASFQGRAAPGTGATNARPTLRQEAAAGVQLWNPHLSLIFFSRRN